MGITSGHHTCPGRITNRGLAVSIIEKCTHLGYSVDIWSFGWGCPPIQPTQSFKSSIEMRRTLGFFGAPKTNDSNAKKDSKIKNAFII